MESTTIALLALAVSFLALFISPYFAHQHTVAELRQRWIDAVRQNVAELLALITSTPVKESEHFEVTPEKNRALQMQVHKLRWQIVLLLDPGNASHKKLIDLIDEYYQAFDRINNMTERDPRTCEPLLKKKWVIVPRRLQKKLKLSL
jgi:uncharacterized protein YnzC (UPF0291/DUF896 family)